MIQNLKQKFNSGFFLYKSEKFLTLIGLTCDGAAWSSGDVVAAGRRRSEGAAAEGEEGQPGEENEEAPVGGKERRAGQRKRRP